ncbi:MAG: ATP-binding protein [Thermodesulfobacteriota bacterium]|nr:ATP-binding protein [Thermodesulfobacteriota bacterium]
MHLSAQQGLCFPKIFMMEGFAKSRGTRSIILLFTIFLCVAGGYYFNFVARAEIDYADVYSAQEFNTLLNYFSLQILYANLFYIPIILTAIWYRKIVIPLAVFLGCFHIYLAYSALGTLIIGTIERAGVFILLAYIIALISEGKAKEQKKVRKSEEKYRSLVESTSDLIYIVDKECNYIFVNDMWLSQFGLLRSQVLGKTFEAFHATEETKNFAKNVNRVFETGTTTDYESYSKKYDKWFIKTLGPIKEPDTKNVIAVSVISKNITERKKAEEDLKKAYYKLKETQDQLIQNEKMAAMGRLTAGVAHQIRNPLGIILMGVEYLDNTISEKDKQCAGFIKIIKQAVGRANKIIIDILQFSRKAELKFESVDICELLDDTINLVERSENLKNIKINRNYPKEPVNCKADKNMFQQVVINLLNNAVDAMQEGGEINVNVFYKSASKLNNKVGKRGDDYFKIGDKMAVVEIEDTGKGIPEDLLAKIFEPFFSTKEAEKGTGLGLSLAHLIIDRHKGSIEVESEANKGTKFIINLQSGKNHVKGE